MHTRAIAVGTSAAAITSLAKAFEPSRTAASLDGPKQAMPAARTASATPATSGASGPTTTRSTPSSRGEPGDRRAVQRVDVVQGGDPRDARVARGGVHLGDLGVARQGQGEGVLTPAVADDEHLHRRITVCSRPGPTPTAQNGAPDISSSART